MKFLAISGSGRGESTNTALLNAVAMIGAPHHAVDVFSDIAQLPVFTPDAERHPLPVPVQQFIDQIANSDGLIIASPEYVRAIPGGLKNAIDWLVSRDEIIDKPIVLMHASHRGEEMLAQLRLVLSTVSDQFNVDIFQRFNLLKLSAAEISQELNRQPHRANIEKFMQQFAEFCDAR